MDPLAVCGSPPFIPHSKHSDLIGTEFELNKTVLYECFNGYQPHGTTEAVCVYQNGTVFWSIDLICVRKYYQFILVRKFLNLFFFSLKEKIAAIRDILKMVIGKYPDMFLHQALTISATMVIYFPGGH